MSNKKEISSGARKAEKLAADADKQQQKQANASATKPNSGRRNSNTTSQTRGRKKGSATNTPSSPSTKKQQREKKRAERLEKKLEHKRLRAERIAALKEKRLEKREARKERRDFLRSESKQDRLERIKHERELRAQARLERRKAAAAERQAKREHKLKLRAEKNAARNDRRHAPGFGGWLAAVISLGVTTLALGTILTFGWMGMNGMQATMYDVQAESLYELNSVVDNLDANLARARVSTSTSDQVSVLTDIAIESEMAEVILERLPLDITMTEEISSFINKMGDSAQSMLYTVATGGELTSSQQAALEYMYSTNLQVKRALNGIVANAKRNDIIDAMRGKGSILAQSFEELSHNTIQTPKGIHDGPFSDSLKTEGASYIDGLEEISAPRAEELAKEYFADYRITGASCSGEAVTNNLTVYNVDISTADGQMLAQISKKGGKVVMFDSYKDCASKNFSVERCITIAQDFLATLGYEQLEPVWASENGTTCNLNFAPVQDGVVIYPDLIKVKVCEERGLVTGVEAISYVLNHTNRNLPTATLSQEQASSSINGNIEVKQSRLALIPLEQHEVLTYEFFGTLGENEYYVYVDAQTGEEVEVLTIIGTAQGKAIL